VGFGVFQELDGVFGSSWTVVGHDRGVKGCLLGRSKTAICHLFLTFLTLQSGSISPGGVGKSYGVIFREVTPHKIGYFAGEVGGFCKFLDGRWPRRREVKEMGVFEGDGVFKEVGGVFGSYWTVVGHERGSRGVLREGPKTLFATYFSSF